MGYTTNASHVRVDRFKPSGKWYDTLEVDMRDHYYDDDIYKAMKDSINESWHINEDMVTRWLQSGGSIVCLKPYHKNAFPIMLKDFR